MLLAMPRSETTMLKTAGGTGSWGMLGGMVALVLFPPIACNNDNTGPSSDTETQVDTEDVGVAISDLLSGTGPTVINALEGFQAEVALLQGNLSDWESELTSSKSGKEKYQLLADTQDQWANTMAAWQVLEVMQLGPSGSSLTAIAGEDLRDEIYSWPTVNPCLIDQETVYNDWGSDSYFTENLVNAYGMDALEHLLFSDSDNACPGQVDINSDGTWDALGESGVWAHRAQFASALTAKIASQTDELIQRWSTGGDDFSGQLALTSDSPYASEQEALNAVYDALFYLETVTKDRKLAVPLGYHPDCGEDLCADEVENLASGVGAESIAANLAGFELLFTGGDGVGFDDLLVELGHGDLAEQVIADLQTAHALAIAIDVPLDEKVAEDTAEVEELYAAVKSVTDVLKGDLSTILALTIPSEAAGDND
jgi:predicted lipoprotein